MVVGSVLLPAPRSPSDVAPLPVYDDNDFVEPGSHAEVGDIYFLLVIFPLGEMAFVSKLLVKMAKLSLGTFAAGYLIFVTVVNLCELVAAAVV